MLTNVKVAGLMAAVLILAVPAVYAADNPATSPNGGAVTAGKDMDKDWHEGKMLNKLAKILHLTDDQKKQLEQAKQKQHETMKTAFEQIKSNREEFNSEIAKLTPDMKKIADLQTQFKTLQGQMTDNQLNSLLDIKKIMTPEQFAGFMALENEKKLDMQHRHAMAHKHGEHKGWNGKDHDEDRD